MAVEQMDPGSDPGTVAALQYRYGILLVDLFTGDRRLYRLYQVKHGMGVFLRYFLPENPRMYDDKHPKFHPRYSRNPYHIFLQYI